MTGTDIAPDGGGDGRITTAEILAISLVDIDAGRWTHEVLIKDHRLDTQACSLGLVGLNGKNWFFRDNQQCDLHYPSDSFRVDGGGEPWNEESREAVFLLAETIKTIDGFEPYKRRELGTAADMVIEFNDEYVAKQGNPSAEVRAWFERAHALAVKRGL